MHSAELQIPTEPPLGATVTSPDRPIASALILQGSGVHNRDGAMPAFGFPSTLYSRLSRALGEQGSIACLRYDKRGHDLPHDAPQEYSLTSRLADAQAALMVLIQRPELAGLPVFLIGHSEGAMLAAKLAVNVKLDLLVNGVVSLAAPFGNVFELNKFRAHKLANGPHVHLQERGRRALEFLSRLEGLFNEDDELSPAEFQAFALAYRDAGYQGWESFQWLREHWLGLAQCDPPAKGIPMLVIQGGRDARLWDDNSQRWRDWCAQRESADFCEIADMGHDLNDARRKAFVVHEEVVSEVLHWISNR